MTGVPRGSDEGADRGVEHEHRRSRARTAAAALRRTSHGSVVRSRRAGGGCACAGSAGACRRAALSIEPRDGRVATRGALDLAARPRCGSAAARARARGSGAASAVRTRSPARPVRAARAAGPAAAGRATATGSTSKRTSTRVFDVFACWPPGPPDAGEPPLELVERDDARAADPQPVHVRRLDSGQTGSVRSSAVPQ